MPKKFGVPEKKSSPFIRKKTAFFSGTQNFFGPSYFEAALVVCIPKVRKALSTMYAKTVQKTPLIDTIKLYQLA